MIQASQSSTTSFLAKLIKQKAVVYAFTAAASVGSKMAYYVLEVTPSKHAAFKKAMKDSANLDLTQFGEFLYKGWAPPARELASEWKEKYDLSIEGWYEA